MARSSTDAFFFALKGELSPSAVEQVVGEVKAKKMETMKAIKRMQVQKEQLSKKQKQARIEYDKVRTGSARR